MPPAQPPPPAKSFRQDLVNIFRSARQVWHMVSWRDKQVFGIAFLVMAFQAVSQNAIPVLLGTMVNQMEKSARENRDPASLYPMVFWFLGVISVVFLVREFL